MDFLIKIGWFTNILLKIISALIGGSLVLVAFMIAKAWSGNGPESLSWTWNIAFTSGFVTTFALEALLAIYTKVTGQWRV